MSDQPHESSPAGGHEPTDPPGPADGPATGAAQPGGPPGPPDDVPPVAGGTDDSPPAQGEGATDSW